MQLSEEAGSPAGMRDRRELRSFGLVLVVIATVCATAFISSCGSGGGGGGNDGTICNQCGDSDGLCVDTQEVTGDDLPSFCREPNPVRSPCIVELRCLRKLDSAQRRCFPADPVTNALDLSYKCDGSRPNPSVAPTTTATPTPTITPFPTLTPSATAETPTPTLSLSPTPEATAGAEDIEVSIDIDTDGDELPSSFIGTVTYPTTKGTFAANGAVACDGDTDGLTAQDAGNGTLTVAFSSDFELIDAISVSCTFHQLAGQTLEEEDLGATVTNGLNITAVP